MQYFARHRLIDRFAIILPLIFGIAWCLFIIRVSPLPFRDDNLVMLIHYQEILDGTKDWQSIWEPYGGHRLPGYYLYYFANIEFLGFNQLVEIIPIIVIFTICVIYIIRTSLSSLSLNGGLSALFIVATTLIFMNGTNIHLSTSSLIAARFMHFAGFILILALIHKFVIRHEDIKNPGKYFVLLAFLSMFLFWGFGRGWGICACISIIGICIISSISFWSDKKVRRHALYVILLLSLICAVYINGLISGRSAQGVAGISSPTLELLMAYFMKTLAGANLGIVNSGLMRGVAHSLAYDAKTLSIVSNFFGLFYLGATAVISILSLRRKDMPRSYWIALFCLFFPIVATLAVSRIRYIFPPFHMRHYFEISVGMFSLFYFAYYFLRTKSSLNNIIIGTFSSVFILFAASTLYHSYTSDRLAKRFEKNVKWTDIALHKNPTFANQRRAGCMGFTSKETCAKSFKIIEDRRLFHTCKAHE